MKRYFILIITLIALTSCEKNLHENFERNLLDTYWWLKESDIKEGENETIYPDRLLFSNKNEMNICKNRVKEYKWYWEDHNTIIIIDENNKTVFQLHIVFLDEYMLEVYFFTEDKSLRTAIFTNSKSNDF